MLCLGPIAQAGRLSPGPQPQAQLPALWLRCSGGQSRKTTPGAQAPQASPLLALCAVSAKSRHLAKLQHRARNCNSP